MKLAVSLLCAAAVLASDISRPDDNAQAALLNPNSAQIDIDKPDFMYSPYGHAGDLSSQMTSDGVTHAGAGAAWANNPTQPSAILSCTSGKYEAFALSGLRACFSCPLGKFQANSGQTGCTNCPAGKKGTAYAKASEGDACENCPVGWSQPFAGRAYCNKDDEVNCGMGHIRTLHGQCIACDAGKYSRTLLQSSASDNGVGSVKCTDCPANHYTDHDGSARCKLCEPGKFNDRSGATYCMWRGKTDILPPRPITRNTNINCAPGQYKYTKQAYTYQHSPTGDDNTATAKELCVPCPAGKFGSGGVSGSCQPCGVGKFNPFAGKDECIDCPGAGSTSTGLTVCHQVAARKAEPTCPAGQFRTFKNARNASSVNLAGDGYHANHAYANIQTTCVPCADGQYRSANQPTESCNRCGVGEQPVKIGADNLPMTWDMPQIHDHSKYAARLCASLNYENGADTVHESRCNADDRDLSSVFWREGATGCASCPVGTAWHRGVCKKCAAGTFQHVPGSVECLPCAPGTWSKPGSQFCSPAEEQDHCTGGRNWTVDGSPCTKTCENQSPVCPIEQKVDRCQCPPDKPFWDDRLEKCNDLAYCTALIAAKTCPEDQPSFVSCSQQLLDAQQADTHVPKRQFEWIQNYGHQSYSSFKKPNGCKQYPCGRMRPVSGCFISKWSREYAEGWTGKGENEDWCHEFECLSGGIWNQTSAAEECGPAPQCSHLRCKFVAGAVKVKYDKLESVGIRHRCGHLDENDPHKCMCTCFSPETASSV